MNTVLIVINSLQKNHVYRAIQGIQACNIIPTVVDDIEKIGSDKYDFILLEASYNKDCSKLRNLYNKNLILFDAEDGPGFFDLKLAFESTKDFA